MMATIATIAATFAAASTIMLHTYITDMRSRGIKPFGRKER